jgi:hypothetical protein
VGLALKLCQCLDLGLELDDRRGGARRVDDLLLELLTLLGGELVVLELVQLGLGGKPEEFAVCVE